MTVISIQTAWERAKALFPGDFAKDEARSANVGYPIYHSTMDGVNAWISDLGNRLEVNLPNGSSFNIWIEKPKPAVSHGCVEVTHYENCTWARNGLRPDELRRLAKKIFAAGKITSVFHHTYGTNDPVVTHGAEWGTVLSGTAAYTVECDGLPIKYDIHMNGFEVTEIIENISR